MRKCGQEVAAGKQGNEMTRQRAPIPRVCHLRDGGVRTSGTRVQAGARMLDKAGESGTHLRLVEDDDEFKQEHRVILLSFTRILFNRFPKYYHVVRCNMRISNDLGLLIFQFRLFGQKYPKFVSDTLVNSSKLYAIHFTFTILISAIIITMQLILYSCLLLNVYQ